MQYKADNALLMPGTHCHLSHQRGADSLMGDAEALREALFFASACGAFTCTGAGAIAAQPTLEQVTSPRTSQFQSYSFALKFAALALEITVVGRYVLGRGAPHAAEAGTLHSAILNS